MSSFQIKPKINKNFKKLDLFLDNNFYDKVEPVIVTLDKPIRIVPQDSEGNILEPIESGTDVAFEITQFIVPKSDLEELLKKASPGETSYFEIGDLNETAFIEIEKLSYDLNNNPTEKVMEILSHPIYKENCLLFTIMNGNIFSSKKLLTNYLNNTVNYLLRNLDIDSDVFLGTVEPKEFTSIYIKQVLSQPEEFKTMKKNLKENFKPFLKNAILAHSAKNLVLNSPRFNEHEFNNIWLETKDRQRENHIFNVLKKAQSNNLISKEFLFDLQKSIISTQLSVKKQPEVTQTFLQNIDELNFSQQEELFTKLNQENGASTSKCGDTIKELLETAKGSLYQIDSQDDLKVVAKINWRAITYQKFPDIEAHLLPIKLDNLLEEKYEDFKISKFNLYQRYEKVNNLIIHKIFEHLEQASDIAQSLSGANSTYDEENPCPFIYLKNDGLFFEVAFPKEIPIKETEKFIKDVIDNINTNNFKDSESIKANMFQNILLLKMKYHKDEMKNEDFNEADNDINIYEKDISFKI